MHRKGRGTSALLQKASAQLRGERVPIAREEDDDDGGLGAYLSSLNKKSTDESKQPQWDKFGEISDLSLSSDEQDAKPQLSKPTSAGSKFLKKKHALSEDTGTVRKPQTSGTGPQLSKTFSKSQQPVYGSKSSALSKAAALTGKYSMQKKKEVVKLSDSDIDLDLSMDEDVIADVKALKKPAKVQQAAVKPVKRSHLSSPSMSFSDDSEVGKTGSSFMKKKPTQMSVMRSVSTKSLDDDSLTDSDFGKAGNKFLKKKIPKTASPKSTTMATSGPENKKRQSMFTLKSAEKYSTNVVLDTDEESLADFIEGLSPSSSTDLSAKTPRSPASGRRPKSFLQSKSPVTLQSPEPMEEIQEVSERSEISEVKSITEEESEESFNLNVMDLDALEPAINLQPTSSKKSKKEEKRSKKEEKKTKDTKKKKKAEKEKKDDIFMGMGLHTVDELLDGASDLEVSEMSDVSEVKVMDVVSDIHTEIGERSPTPLRSILSPTPRSIATPRSSRGRVRLSLGDVTEIRSRSPSPQAISTARPVDSVAYSEDFEETEGIKTIYSEDEEQDSATESISEITESNQSSPRRSQRSSRRSSIRSNRRRSSDYGDYTEDFTSTTESRTQVSSEGETDTESSYTQSYATATEDRSRSPSPQHRPSKAKKSRTVHVQTQDEPGLLYHWNTQPGGSMAGLGPAFGLSQVDPTPIATHVVGADALEAMTAYSPSVIALNDMLRQQLQLTNTFIENHKRMHQAYISSMQPSFSYTTLRDTKQFIKKHRKKTLTFEEALRQVKEEMNMENS